MRDVYHLRKCPVCLSEDSVSKWEVPSELYFQNKLGIYKAKIVECKKCKTQYTNPIIHPNIGDLQYTDPLSGYNTKEFDNPEQLCWEDQVICLHEIINNLQSPSSKILDFACGRGGMVYLCQRNRIDAVGIDLNVNNILLGLSLGAKTFLYKI